MVFHDARMKLDWHHSVKKRERMTARYTNRPKDIDAGYPGDCYFAYGSNLNVDDLQNWCRGQGLSNTALRCSRGVARLADNELIFDYYSERRRGGVLNLRPRIGQIVEGVLFEVDVYGRDALDRKEGVPTCYERVPVHVFDGEGMSVDAFTYRVPPERCGDFVKPTAAYLETVRSGLETFGLCTRQLEAAAADTAAPFALDGVFVYGTLMRCEERFHALAQVAEFESTLLATTRGRLLDLGAYPAIVRDLGCSVDGEFMRFRNLPAVLDLFDPIEGFEGYNAGSLYHRVPTTAQVGDGRFRSVWSYVLAETGTGRAVIASGSWRKHRSRHQTFMEALFSAHAVDQENSAKAWERVVLGSVAGGLEDIAQDRISLAERFIRGTVSEYDLAQHTGKWVCVPW